MWKTLICFILFEPIVTTFEKDDRGCSEDEIFWCGNSCFAWPNHCFCGDDSYEANSINKVCISDSPCFKDIDGEYCNLFNSSFDCKR